MFPELIMPDDYGLVHVGGELSVHNVIEAYTKGCFPWTGEHPIPWCAPDPRMVLFPENFRASRSLRKLRRQKRFTIRFDRNFRGVMERCATISRKRQKGTWITDNMLETYCELHRMNIAHSVEAYDKTGRLCGGLYGLNFGHAFFGESMFSEEPNTSKLALYELCRVLSKKRFDFIDCQQVTLHLIRLGAVPISHPEYIRLLRSTLMYESWHERWVSCSYSLSCPNSAGS